MKTIAAFLFIWLFLAAVGYGVGSLVFGRTEPPSFAENGVAVYGVVTAKDAGNHAAVSYSYKVDGKEYRGVGGAGRGNPAFEELRIGQQVVVFYDRQNPSSSMLGYPQAQANANKYGVWFAALFFPVFPMLALSSIYLIYTRAKRPNDLS